MTNTERERERKIDLVGVRKEEREFKNNRKDGQREKGRKEMKEEKERFKMKEITNTKMGHKLPQSPKKKLFLGSIYFG